MKMIIATIKSWNIENAKRFSECVNAEHQVLVLTKKEDLTKELVDEFAPDYIFFPHWSYIISKNIYENYECVVFHMADLPFGRGGSPLQNLIVRGYKDTKISALRVEKELDAGPIYFKELLSLDGSADEILRRASDVIFLKMLPRFLNEKITPKEQEGEVTIFRRRKPEEGELKPQMDLDVMYDYIRMLDAEGYPNAFIEYGDWVMEFSGARLVDDGLEARVKFRRKTNE